MRKGWVALAFVSAIGCQKNESPPAASTPAAPAPANPVAAAPAMPAAAPATLQCDEDRYQKWLALRKEQNTTLGTGLQATGKAVEANKGTPGAQAAGFGGLVATGQQLEALRTKYGFTQPELGRYNALSSSVTNARTLDNPMLKGTVEMMHKMQQQGGQQKASADKFFQDEEEKQKKAEARARQQYGDACVDVWMKHVAEIQEVQLAGAAAVLGGPKKPK